MATLGEKLRREREVRGVSLKEISEATHIHENFLFALEENDFGVFPAAVFVIGFLRNYATHLGLDADKIVAEYEGMKIERQTELPHVPVDNAEDKRLVVFGVIGSLFLLLVLYIGYVNWPGEGTVEQSAKIKIEPKTAVKSPPVEAVPEKKPVSEKTGAAGDDKAPPVEPGKPAEVEPEVKEEKKAAVAASPSQEKKEAVTKKAPPKKTEPVKKAAVKKEPEAAAVAAAPPKVKKKAVKKTVAKKAKPKPAPVKRFKHRLVVEAGEEDAWILVVVDDELVRDMFVRAGQKVIINGNDSFNFTTGNARQIKLEMDGKPLEFEAPPSNVIRSWNLPLTE